MPFFCNKTRYGTAQCNSKGFFMQRGWSLFKRRFFAMKSTPPTSKATRISNRRCDVPYSTKAQFALRRTCRFLFVFALIREAYTHDEGQANMPILMIVAASYAREGAMPLSTWESLQSLDADDQMEQGSKSGKSGRSGAHFIIQSPLS